MYTSINYNIQMHGGGYLIHKQGNLIYQFGVWIGHHLKIKLLLVLVLYL